MNRIIIVLLILVFNSLSIFSQITLDNFNKIKEFAAKNNIEYKESLINLSVKINNIEPLLKFEESKITGEATIDYTGESIYKSSIELKIIEQLEATGSINNDLEGSIGLNINPFTNNGNREITDLQYKIAYITSVNTLKKVENNALMNFLNWSITKKNISILNDKVNRNLDIYNESKVRYDIGNITLDDLHEDLIKYSTTRKFLLEEEQKLKTLETTLYNSLGAVSNEVIITEITLEELKKELDIIKENGMSNHFNPESNYGYNLALLNQQIEKNNKDHTWFYTPDLSIKGNIPYNEGDIELEEITGSISFSIALDDFNFNDRKIANDKYELAVKSSSLALKEAESNFKKAIEKIVSSEINSNIWDTEYQQAQILLSEAILLLNNGTYSKLDLEEKRIFLQESELNLMDAYSQEYIAWLEYLNY